MKQAQREVSKIRKSQASPSPPTRDDNTNAGSARRFTFTEFVDAHNISQTDSDDYMTPIYNDLNNCTHRNRHGHTVTCAGVARHVGRATPHTDGATLVPDSGATSDMFKEKRHFIGDYRKCKDLFVYMGDGSPVPVAGIGTVRIKVRGRVIVLPNVLHVPALDCNLMSITRHGRRGPGCSYLVENNMTHLSFPDFTLSLEIPANGDPHFALDALDEEDFDNHDYCATNNNNALDSFKSRLAFLSQVHRGRLQTRSQSKRWLDTIKLMLQQGSQNFVPSGSYNTNTTRNSTATNKRHGVGSTSNPTKSH